ncbi:hypothetical protein ASAP_2551 [Asaia bogorensis]|uniref:Uncharacterized protein n=1 Tax=Asaia bogorensis TaxID=91915 RepID=A0A060QLA1_9PROT|nr:hypothetical protein ASAP_2551 [Asaia bogorensis]
MPNLADCDALGCRSARLPGHQDGHHCVSHTSCRQLARPCGPRADGLHPSQKPCGRPVLD